MRRKETVRFSLILAVALLFAGLLVFSAFNVRYSVQGGERTEFDVIEYSLTDSIKRAQNGRFIVTAVSADGKKEGPSDAQPQPCPT